MTTEAIVDMLHELKLTQAETVSTLKRMDNTLERMESLKHESRVQRLEDSIYGHEGNEGLVAKNAKLEARLVIQEAETKSILDKIKGGVFVAGVVGSLLGYFISIYFK